MEQPSTPLGWAFGDFSVDLRARTLLDAGGRPVPLTTKAFDTLAHLLERPGRLVGKDELLAAVWPGRVVEENNLTQAVSALRKAFGGDAADRRYIVTVPGRGYRFVAEVRALAPGEVAADGTGAGAGPDAPRRSYRGPALAALALALAAIAAGTWWRGRAPAAAAEAAVRSVAVLPFRTLDGAAPDPLLEAGLAETVIARLSGSQRLRVRALGSTARQAAGRPADPAGLARALGVDYLVAGTVQARDGRVRVTAHLARPDGAVAWSDAFDAEPAAVFALQDDIADAVARALSIDPPDGAAAQRRPCDGADAAAYRHYLAGRHLLSAPRPERLQRAIGQFRQALERDPSCARAWAGQAFAWRAMTIAGDMDPRQAFPLAEAAVSQALELDPALAEAHAARGFNLFWHDWDWAGAEAALQRAIALNPSSVEARFAYAHLLHNIGRADRALAEVERARQLDPLSPLVHALHVQCLAAAGRTDEALALAERTLQVDPDFWIGLLMRGSLRLQRGERAAAIADLERARALSGGNSLVEGTLGLAYAGAGREAEAEAVLAALRARSAEGYVPPTSLAAVEVGLGRPERALALLERAHEARDLRMAFLGVDMRWNPLRGDPRFAALARAMRLSDAPATGL